MKQPSSLGAATIAAAALCVTSASPAYANATPSYQGNYNFKARLATHTYFRVYKHATVHVALQGTYGPSYSVSIQVERQTCGTFGCHWRGSTFGGTCQRTLFVDSSKTCNFTVPISSRLHRIVMTKRYDEVTIKGKIQVS